MSDIAAQTEFDIVSRLRKTIARRAGTCDSDVNALTIPVEVPWGVVEDAIAEIERLRATIAQLRAVAGVVSVDSFSYADLKKDLRERGPDTVPVDMSGNRKGAI